MLDDLKAKLRGEMLALRGGCDPAAGRDLARHMLAEAGLARGAAVAGFWPIGTEIDLRPLLHGLAARGHPVLLPVTPPRGQPLSFARWQPGEALAPERFGTVRPTGEPGVPEVVMVPLLAWDGAGRRLGYGGGYYDRTLPGLPGCLAIGCAYAAQRVDQVPAGRHDALLDAVATEQGVTWFRRPRTPG